MFLGQINNYVVQTGQANTVIPIRTVSNTNDKVVNNKGVISFLRNGKYDIDATISVSGDSVQNVTVNLYTDDGIRTSVTGTIPTSPSDTEPGTVNISLVDAIDVILTRYASVANIYLAVDQSDVTVNGYIRIEYVR